MSTENFSTIIDENRKLGKEYLDTRLEIYKLVAIRAFSKAAGYLMWVISLFLLTGLLVVFLGIVTGFWFSKLTGSYTIGFGLASLLIVFVMLLVIVLRNAIFINPVIRSVIRKTTEEDN